MKDMNFFRQRYQRLFKSNPSSSSNRMSRAEYFLWNFVVGDNQLKGYSFQRRCPVLHFTADFLCMPLRLIVEIVERRYGDEEVQDTSSGKSLILEDAGFELLQFTTHEIKMKTAWVREIILKRIEEIEKSIEPLDLLPPVCINKKIRSYPPH